MNTRPLAIAFALIAVSAPLSAQQPAPPVERPTTAPALTPGAGTGPNGATLRCRDGSYPASGAPDSACESKGGVLVRFPRRVNPAAAEVRQEVRRPDSTAAARVAPRDTTPPEGFRTYEERRAEQAATAPLLRRPEGARLLCTDGTYIVRDTTAARCAQRGGVKLRFAAPTTP